FPLSSLFLFQSSAPHPHLPSFPTRRSSDLEKRIERGPLLLDVGLHVLERLAVSREHVLQLLDLVIGELEPVPDLVPPPELPVVQDRKSTRLNSSHVAISYAVFCLKKKKKNK